VRWLAPVLDQRYVVAHEANALRALQLSDAELFSQGADSLTNSIHIAADFSRMVLNMTPIRAVFQAQ